MAKKKPGKPAASRSVDESQAKKPEGIKELRHKEAKRKNNPPAVLAAEGTVPAVPKARYAYSPRRPPELRFDPTGKPDALPALLRTAGERALNKDELRTLAEALRVQEPWLEWAGKRELPGFAVDPVALHIHERVSTQAILKVAARQDVQRSLFADPQQDYHEAVQFYRHDIAWTNRLILGDSLQVMSSLARREDLAGKVQMIYIDPPYGIKFASNFQPEIGRRDVKDKEADLTREPEMVRAYRDTWHLGIHSYLKYLRDRLIVARELLADSGSLFVQISDENVHYLRTLLVDIFGQDNFLGQIAFAKTTGQTTKLLAETSDYLLWFAKDKEKVKFRDIFEERKPIENPYERYVCVQTDFGQIHDLSVAQKLGEEPIPEGRIVKLADVSSQTGSESSRQPFVFQDREFRPSSTRGWSTSNEGLARAGSAGYLHSVGNSLLWINPREWSSLRACTSDWRDVRPSGFGFVKQYVVQTTPDVVQRCLLMSTDPGDLVLDPTCGSGTTAAVAEQWGRRWITIDTSRVAISIARQRLLTAKFDYFKLRELNVTDKERNPKGMWLYNGDDGVRGPATFKCKNVAHSTLRSIAQNTNLDPIIAKHETILVDRLKACNTALGKVTKAVRDELAAKLAAKQKKEGARSISDADRRRWELPKAGEAWQQWQVPFDTDADWPKELRDAVTAFRAAWRSKLDEVNDCIAANADHEELVDQPEVVRGVTRVSGPFTVEAVQPPEMTLGDETAVETIGGGMFDGAPEDLDKTFLSIRPVEAFGETQNLSAYLDTMVRLLKQDGVRFPNNKQMSFTRLEPLYESGNASGVHAEGRWVAKGQTDDDPNGPANVAIVIGPQYGPITSMQVVEAIRTTFRRGYHDLVFAGFSFDGAAQGEIQNNTNPKLRVHMANIRPDVNPGMDGLLKETPGSQLFTVFGQPRTKLTGPNKAGDYTVTMEGVDVYNPVDNTIRSTGADKVAAWFLDGDYDGRTFCITQAFFPDRSAWDKLARALDGIIDEDRFQALSGTKSLPFPAGKNKCVAVKVIDPRGNEVMQVHKL